MVTYFTQKDLYGGAITVEIPATTIDASDLRQVPNHQEVFLSQNTLTSIIFEINQYQAASTISANSHAHFEEHDLSSGMHTVNMTNTQAGEYHFFDVIQRGDSTVGNGLKSESVTLARESVSKFPAVYTTGTIVSHEIDRAARSSLPLDWQANPAQTEYQTKVMQLLVRIEEYETDFCVRVNVPTKELGNVESDAAKAELSEAEEIVRKIVETLDIKDFGLFGSE